MSSTPAQLFKKTHKLMIGSISAGRSCNSVMTYTVTFTSVTMAMKARRALERLGIRCKLIKTDASVTARGCAYAIVFDAVNYYDVVGELKKKDIPYSGIRTEGGGGV